MIAVSEYSLFMSFLWANIGIVGACLFSGSNNFIQKYGLSSLSIIGVAIIARAFISFDFASAIVIRSSFLYPKIISFLAFPFTLQGYTFNLYQILLGIWAFGFIYKLVPPVYRHCRFVYKVRLSAQSEQGERYLRILNNVKKNNQTTVTFYDGSSDLIPCTLGLLAPIIILPRTELSDRELRYIIAHEWCHYHLKHLWVKIFLFFLSCLFWWNPFNKILRRRVSTMLEVHCDQTVLKDLDTEERLQYLETLLLIAKQAATNTVKVNAFSNQLLQREDFDAQQRFELILDYDAQRSRRTQRLLVSTVTAVILILSTQFIIQPAYFCEPKDDEPYFAVTAEDSYIIRIDSETYGLVVNDTVTELNAAAFKELSPIIEIKGE